jgi:head-tail adaptor
MATPTGSGKMREKIEFQLKVASPDEYGNEQTEWRMQFTTAAELIPLKGGEPVLAARLTGVQPFVIRIRSSTAARAVTTAWRAVDARNPSRIFNITSVANVDQKNAYIDMMATQGVAT